MVFMMDSWWNPSVEYQAMDRIHRLGQKRPVKVVKLVVEDSIEDQIVQLQHKKLAMTEAALSTDPDAALGKLTVEDVRVSCAAAAQADGCSWASYSRCNIDLCYTYSGFVPSVPVDMLSCPHAASLHMLLMILYVFYVSPDVHVHEMECVGAGSNLKQKAAP